MVFFMDYRSFDSSDKPPPLGETPSSEKPYSA